MKQLEFKREDETDEERQTGGRSGYAQVAVFRNKHGRQRVTLKAGNSDDVEIYQDKGGANLYVCAINRRLTYAGVQHLVWSTTSLPIDDPRKGEYVDVESSIFLQGDPTYDVLGRNWDELSDRLIFRRLFRQMNGG